MGQNQRTRAHHTRIGRTLVLIPVVLCVLAAVIASPVPRPEPAAAQSALPPPCTEIVFNEITCDPSVLEVSEDDVAVTTPFLVPKPIGLVAVPTSWLYLGAQQPVLNVTAGPPSPPAPPGAIQGPGCHYADGTVWEPPLPNPGPFVCILLGGRVATYVRIRIPAGQEIDFGSPDEDGVTRQTANWWPALVDHLYEEKGVFDIEYRVYWREWLIGCDLSPYLLGFGGWYCRDPLGLTGPPDLFVEADGTEVAFITQNTMDPYQVDESRGTLESW